MVSLAQPIRFFCPSCAKKVVVPGEYSGRNTNCPKCGTAVTVPGTATVQAPRPKRVVVKSSMWKPVLIAVSMLMVVGIAVTGTILIMRGGGEDTKMADGGAGGEAGGEAGENASLEEGPEPGSGVMPDEQTIAKSVGMVICGFKVSRDGAEKEKTSLYMPIEKAEFAKLDDESKEECYVFKDGTILLRIPGGTGSCFVITEDGYAITNMHVVEKVNDFQKDANSLNGFLKRTSYDSASAAVWVALDGVVHPAKIIHVSSQYDCAVIKVDGLKGLPAWKLSKAGELKRDVEVATLGFPGASRGKMNAEEAALQQAKSKNAKSIRDFFLDEDFKYVTKSGSVSVVKTRVGEGVVIDHTATINGGNSGGPLVRTKDGVVAGINTWHSKVGANTFLSIKIDSVKKEIDQFVPNAEWVE